MPLSRKILTDPQVLAYTYIAVKFHFRSSINCDLQRSKCITGFALKGPPKWGFGVILGVGAKIFGGKAHPSWKSAFSDIFNPDLMRRVVAFGMGIAIAIGENLGKFGGPQLP